MAAAERPVQGISAMVHCAGQRHFRVRADGERAVIWVGGDVLTLRRSASDDMVRYSGPTAALAIEGDFVAFVMNDSLEFAGCRVDRTAAGDMAARM